MPLTPGTKLGQYEVVESIGAGGMGEVYRARDMKLGREVAIKVLPEELSQDRERLARFEREARLLASLNHPAIATLHGFEDDYLVMELVEGETLAERISGGAMAADEALPLFVQIAEGLEAAHEKGIVHRDLKPANIKITPDGQIKILDFGLAKAFAPEDDVSAESSQSPTLTKGTALGTIMGTAAYMSPEQARGTAVDRRTDVWAFGCCLFEALTGKRAFDGEHVTDILAAVMRAEPDWKLLGSLHVRRIAERCLRKDRKQRFQHIGDVRIALEEPLPSEAPTPARRLLVPILLTAIATAGVTALVSSVIRQPPPSDIGTMELTIQLPADRRLHTRWDQPRLALTPDGDRLVFLGGRGEGRQIYVREMSDRTVRPVDGTEGAEETALFVSPDGEWVGFYRDETLWRTRIDGGIPVPILESSDRIEGARWPESDTIFFRRGLTSPLYRISADGGEPEALSEIDPDFNEWHASPRLLPSGDALLFTSSVGSFESSHIDVLSLSSGERKRVLEDVFFVEYAASGHLIYGRSETLFAVPFDAARLEVTGPATPVVNGVLMDRGEHRAAYFTMSAAGTLVYAPATEAVRNRLVWVDRAGETERLNLEPGQFRGPRLSPDGSKLLVRSWSGNEIQVQLIDLRRNVAAAIATGADSNSFPVWSPDGERIVFQSNLAGPYNMFVMPADGSGRPERLLQSPHLQQPYSWSSNGEQLLYVDGYQQARLSVLSMGSSGGDVSSWLSISPTVMTITPRFSPDGRFVAFVSNESGRYEVYVSEFDLDSEVRPRQKVSRSGGWEPAWSPDGGELYFRSADGTALMVISVEPGGELDIGEPRKLFYTPRMPAPIWYGGYFYDVAADGRFLMVHETEERDQPMNLVVVLNWLDELERLVPTN